MAEPEAPATLCFSVKHAGLSLKISLDAKWQKKSLLVAVVAPFIKSFNKKRVRLSTAAPLCGFAFLRLGLPWRLAHL